MPFKTKIIKHGRTYQQPESEIIKCPECRRNFRLSEIATMKDPDTEKLGAAVFCLHCSAVFMIEEE